MIVLSQLANSFSLSLLLGAYLHSVVFIHVCLMLSAISFSSCVHPCCVCLMLPAISFSCISVYLVVSSHEELAGDKQDICTPLCSSMFVCLMFTAISFFWSLLLAVYLYLVVSNHEEPAEDIQLL